MIERFNRQQTIYGMINLAFGVGIVWLTWEFFRVAAWLILGRFGWSASANYLESPAVWASALTGIVWIAGVVQWRRGEVGAHVFADSAFYASIDGVVGRAFVTHPVARRLSGVAYVLSLLFLSGPWLICNGVVRLRGRLPNDPKLEARMREVLGWMRASGEWETAMKYRDNAEELGALIRCGLVEYSVTKMRVKAVPAKAGA